MRRNHLIWSALVVVLATVALVAAVLTGLIDDYSAVAIFLAGVAAVGAVGSVIITAVGNAMNSRQLRDLAAQQVQAAADIRRLAELTESSLEEARAQKPEPVVRFVVEKERVSAEAATYRRQRFSRHIEIEQIVAAEREAALATLTSETAAAERTGTTPVRLSAFASTLRGLELGPVTEDERRSFMRRVDAYADALRGWLRSYGEYRRVRDSLLPVLLRFENVGRVPAHDVRVTLHFPDGCERGQAPEAIGYPPATPRFQRRRFGLAGLDRALTVRDPSAMLRDLRFQPPPVHRNVSRPRYRKGSLIVEFDIEKLRHGIPEDADDVVWLTIESDGEFVVPWEIHAENLGSPVRGELRLQITTAPEEGTAIGSLAELKALLPNEDDADESDHD